MDAVTGWVQTETAVPVPRRRIISARAQKVILVIGKDGFYRSFSVGVKVSAITTITRLELA